MSRRGRAASLAPALALALALAGWAAPGSAQSTPAWAYDVTHELMSPFCPGVTLAECPSPQAKRLVAWIGVQAAAGRSRADVLDELYERYGDQIRATPRAEGFGVAAYLLPAFAFLAGGGVLALFLRRATRRSTGGAVPSAAPAALDPEAERRLDEVLSR